MVVAALLTTAVVTLASKFFLFSPGLSENWLSELIKYCMWALAVGYMNYMVVTLVNRKFRKYES